jgi:polar amino acid transport system permease protein
VVLGLLFALMRISASPVLFHIATTYVEVVRGVPLLVILLFANFVFAPWFRVNFPGLAPYLTVALIVLGVAIAAIVLWNARVDKLTAVEIVQALVLLGALFAVMFLLVQHFAANSTFSPAQIAILGLGFGYGAFLAELFRAGIQSIGKGQMEAARSLGMTYIQAMTTVILPQAFRVVLPPLGNEFIAVLKDSSLAALIAVPELTQQARLYAARNFQVFPSYITIGALYLIMTLLLSFFVRTIERRLTTTGR